MLIQCNNDFPHEGLRPYMDLKDVQLRTKWETENGVFIAESWNVIERAREAGYSPISFLVSEQWARKGAERLQTLADPDTPIYVLPEEDTTHITGFRVHRGAMALMERTPLPAPSSLLKPSSTVAVLEGLVDHTNVGAIFRSAAALGIDAVFISPDCADPLYRRSVRVSMGAVFQVPWTRLVKYPDPQLFTAYGFTTWALTPHGDAKLGETTRPRRLALIVGSEGPGLSPKALTSADCRITIPMSHDVDSLNVAQAAAIAFWATRQ
ncbi:TrmH family RNA methyltransferase [Scrofimicrobium canadense]|nr:RNA methyltransferase [Scrofimicrobium canadense]